MMQRQMSGKMSNRSSSLNRQRRSMQKMGRASRSAIRQMPLNEINEASNSYYDKNIGAMFDKYK